MQLDKLNYIPQETVIPASNLNEIQDCVIDVELNKSDINHNHDQNYSPKIHSHSEYSLKEHTHDDRYTPKEEEGDDILIEIVYEDGNVGTMKLKGWFV